MSVEPMAASTTESIAASIRDTMWQSWTDTAFNFRKSQRNRVIRHSLMLTQLGSPRLSLLVRRGLAWASCPFLSYETAGTSVSRGNDFMKESCIVHYKLDSMSRCPKAPRVAMQRIRNFWWFPRQTLPMLIVVVKYRCIHMPVFWESFFSFFAF